MAPFLARSVGFLPVFFPPEGCLGHASVHTQPFPVDTLQTVVLQQSGLPNCQEDAIGDPLLKAIMGGGPGAELRRVQGLPLATSTQDEEDGVHAHTIRSAWSTTTKTVAVHMLGQVDRNLDPEVVRYAPVFRNDVMVHG